MPRIEDAWDILLKRPRRTQGCRTDYDDDESLNNLLISDPILLLYDAVWTGEIEASIFKR